MLGPLPPSLTAPSYCIRHIYHHKALENIKTLANVLIILWQQSADPFTTYLPGTPKRLCRTWIPGGIDSSWSRLAWCRPATATLSRKARSWARKTLRCLQFLYILSISPQGRAPSIYSVVQAGEPTFLLLLKFSREATWCSKTEIIMSQAALQAVLVIPPREQSSHTFVFFCADTRLTMCAPDIFSMRLPSV